MARNGNGSVSGWENDVHIVLAAKGGIGKTYISSLLAQYAASKGRWSARLALYQWLSENWTRRAYGTREEVPA